MSHPTTAPGLLALLLLGLLASCQPPAVPAAKSASARPACPLPPLM